MFKQVFSVENRAVYEKTWKNIVEPDRSQMTIWRMRITCWIPKATNTHSEYVRHIDFPLQHRLHERALYVHFLSCRIWNFFYSNLRVTNAFLLWVLRSGQQCNRRFLSSGVWLLFSTSVTLESAKRRFPVSKSRQCVNNETLTLIWNIPFGVAIVMSTEVLNM
jgi:hypothetical protein